MTGKNLLFATNTSYPKYSTTLKDTLMAIGKRDNTDYLILDAGQMNEAVQQTGLLEDGILDDTVRGMLAVESAGFARRLDLPTVYCDYKSSDDFYNDIHAVTDERFMIIPQTGKTAGDARREATSEGIRRFDPDIIGWTEPEKMLMVYNFPHLIAKVPEEGLLIPSRKIGVFGLTYPYDQFLTEQWTNEEITILMNKQPALRRDDILDFMSGIRMFPARSRTATTMLREDFTDHTYGHRYFGWYAHLMVPPIVLQREGFPVISEPITYLHPAIQSSLEFHGPHREAYQYKRLEQMIVVYAMCAGEIGEPYSTVESFSKRMGERLHAESSGIELRRSIGERL